MQGFPSEVKRTVDLNVIGLTVDDLDGLEIALAKGLEVGTATGEGKRLINHKQESGVEQFRTLLIKARKQITDDETAPKAMPERTR